MLTVTLAVLDIRVLISILLAELPNYATFLFFFLYLFLVHNMFDSKLGDRWMEEVNVGCPHLLVLLCSCCLIIFDFLV